MRWIAALAVLAACGDNQLAPDARPADAAPDALTYPAFAAQLPKVLKGPGAVMASVRVVPVFFPGDPLRDQLLAALTSYAAASEWPLLGTEYGYGALTIAAPIDLTTAPATVVTNTDIETLLTTSLDGTHPEWGATDATTLATSIYAVFYPSSVTITGQFGTSCVDFGAYHNAVGASGIIYAALARCPKGSIFPTDLAEQFAVLTHELNEAASDPLLDAWGGIRTLDAAWAVAFHGSEIGDMCQSLADDYITPDDVGVMIQRQWSNKEAMQFHDPCLPTPPGQGPYIASVPDRPDIVQIGTSQLAGVNIQVGNRKTIEVRLASEAPTAAWTVQAQYVGHTPAPINFVFDRTTGVNGDVLNLKITAVSRPSNGYAAFELISTLDGRRTAWPGIVGITP